MACCMILNEKWINQCRMLVAHCIAMTGFDPAGIAMSLYMHPCTRLLENTACLSSSCTRSKFCPLRRCIVKLCMQTHLRLGALAPCCVSNADMHGQVYDPAKVQRMLDALHSEAVSMMLFLRHVEQLQILDWHQGEPFPATRFTCSLADVSQQLRMQRSLFSQASVVPPRQPLGGSHRLRFVVQKSGTDDRQQTYLVSQMRGSTARAAELARKCSQTFGAPAIPWGAVAAELSADPGDACSSERLCRAPCPLLWQPMSRLVP